MRALHEVCCEAGRPVTRKQISQKQGISEHFLEKIFIGLQKKELISSVRGPGGGFVLNRLPQEITLWDIYIAVDDPEYQEGQCYQKAGNSCEMHDACRVKSIWYKFGKIMKKSMSEITLADIAAN